MRRHAQFITWFAVVLIVAGVVTFFAMARGHSGGGLADGQVAAPGRVSMAVSGATRAAGSTSAPTTKPSARELSASGTAHGPLDSVDRKRYAADIEFGMRKYDPHAARDIPVFDAVLSGKVAEVGEYLDSGGTPNLTAQYSSVGNRTTLLIEAVSVGQRAVISELVARGANVNLNPGGDNNAPLVMAAAEGETDVVGELLNHGANIDQMDGVGITAIHAAVLGGNYATVKLLLDQGAGINTALTPNGRVPPYVANSKKPNLVAIRKLLIAHGARPGDPSSAGGRG